MTTNQIAILAVQGGLFLLWAFVAFRLLFQLRRRGADKTGRTFPGPLTLVDVTRDWLNDPDCRGQRIGFAVLTLVLVIVSALQAITRSVPAPV